MNTPPLAPLIAYCLRGLDRCWQPALGRWSHKYHLDGRADPNESVPESDVYYSLNVLLGYARIADAAAHLPQPPRALFASLAAAMPSLPMRHYAYGIALWAAAELDADVPGAVLDQLRARLADTGGWAAQDLGLVISGAVALSKRDPSWRTVAERLVEQLLGERLGPHALFYEGGSRIRREFGSFATQVYSALALYHAGEAFDDDRALAAANACLAQLIALQGPRGEWAWFYHPRSGLIVDWYEVYSVHQHGMAPAILHHAIAHGVPGARAAMERGFAWLFGDNEMGRTMLRPELSLIHRSQRRAGLRGERRVRAAESIGRGLLRLPAALAGQGLAMTTEMRSYEMGWVLWSFGGREDWPALTSAEAFH